MFLSGKEGDGVRAGHGRADRGMTRQLECLVSIGRFYERRQSSGQRGYADL